MTPNPYVIMSDSNSELPLRVAKAYDLQFVHMPYLLDGVEYPYDLGEKTDLPAFFARMRAGSTPTTTTYPPQHYIELWGPVLSAGQDILFISFSSRLSNAFQFATTAAEEVADAFPQRRIALFDTRSISGGMALLVYRALRMQESGASMDEVLSWLEENAPRANHYFTVGDLVYLKRGGRVSSSAALMGTMLSIKPILILTAEGTIISSAKAKGRRNSIRALAQSVIERAEDPEENACVIIHADCESDALALRAMIEEKVRFKEIFVQFIGPVIGAHAGPDTLGVCFMGRERE